MNEGNEGNEDYFVFCRVAALEAHEISILPVFARYSD